MYHVGKFNNLIVNPNLRIFSFSPLLCPNCCSNTHTQRFCGNLCSYNTVCMCIKLGLPLNQESGENTGIWRYINEGIPTFQYQHPFHFLMPDSQRCPWACHGTDPHCWRGTVVLTSPMHCLTDSVHWYIFLVTYLFEQLFHLQLWRN